MNYHVLPCGTVIPPEGIEAWVRLTPESSWVKKTIVACQRGNLITESGCLWAIYSLTDPTKPKKTNAEIAFEKFGNGTIVKNSKWPPNDRFTIECLSSCRQLVVGRSDLGQIASLKFDNIEDWYVYEPKKRLVTPMELLGKFAHDNDGSIRMFICIEGQTVYYRGVHCSIKVLLEQCKGYSDTPTSEIKSFWVEEV